MVLELRAKVEKEETDFLNNLMMQYVEETRKNKFIESHLYALKSSMKIRELGCDILYIAESKILSGLLKDSTILDSVVTRFSEKLKKVREDEVASSSRFLVFIEVFADLVDCGIGIVYDEIPETLGSPWKGFFSDTFKYIKNIPEHHQLYVSFMKRINEEELFIEPNTIKLFITLLLDTLRFDFECRHDISDMYVNKYKDKDYCFFTPNAIINEIETRGKYVKDIDDPISMNDYRAMCDYKDTLIKKGKFNMYAEIANLHMTGNFAVLRVISKIDFDQCAKINEEFTEK